MITDDSRTIRGGVVAGHLHSASHGDRSYYALFEQRQPTLMVNAVKIFKKTAPNGKVTCYLSRRDFVDHLTHIAPVDGVVVVDDAYLRGRNVFAQVTVTYRYGREEDEVMGLHFSKEMELVNQQVYPSSDISTPTEVQDRLLKKLGGNAYPFSISLPKNAPNSVILEPGNEDSSQPLGVIYDLRLYVADKKEERPHKRNSVAFAVRKVQFAALESTKRQPQTLVSKSFTLSPGKLNLEVSLAKDVYYHGQQIEATLSINNASKKTVKGLRCQVVQHVECTMNNQQFSRVVACLESREGCPITPGSNLNKTFSMTPLASTNKGKFGIALDGKVKDQDSNLASSTMVAPGKNANDALGIVVSYSLRVKLNCGAIAGELAADLPFKLAHPVAIEEGKVNEEGMVFEDFARLRRGQSVNDGV
ncbi:arrestin homolog [Oratosquilla oratoria]|uniref:arrestin homolog n=1 Tax=Oratosquilla oratoria TaxID=337810 RepID=UPI003F7717CA